MSFGGYFDGNNGSTAGSITRPPPLTSSGLSLGLQSNMEGQGDLGGWGMPANTGGNSVGGGDGIKEDENESRSGSDNQEAISEDDFDQENPRKKKKKRYHRHTPQQIQELESLFKECPHPDEKQRTELSMKLNLDSRQVKFWFQNRRTQMKTQMERHENLILRQENEKLRIDNINIRDALRNPICNNCGSPAMLGEVSLEEQHLRIENARLKDELDRVCALAGKFLGRPVSSLASPISTAMPSSLLELGVGSNSFNGLSSMAPMMPHVPDYLPGMTTPPITSIVSSSMQNMSRMSGNDRSMLLEIALTAMDELMNMAQMYDPLWIPSLDGGLETLNFDEYNRVFHRVIGMSPVGYVSEASRQTGTVIISSVALVETLMDAARWADMFPCMIARTTTTDIISSGVGGTSNGSLQLMHAELQVLSPLVPVREVNFLRFAKQHAEGIWGVVDVSIDSLGESLTSARSFSNCRRLPSGCVVQDMPNGSCKVTWVEHNEYDESSVHHLYRQLIRTGMGFGAPRWLANLQRQCECLAIIMSSSMISREETATITLNGRRSMLKLAQRMTDNFCAGVCASSVHEWNKLTVDSIGEDVRVMTRKSINDPGEPAGVVLSAATSVWIPVAPQRLFDFLREGGFRGEWDILANGAPMREMAHIAKGQDTGNAVSLLRATAVNNNQSSMLVLQETYTDASGSLVVYAPVDVPAMHIVMSGGESNYVAVLPSGFAILPDTPTNINLFGNNISSTAATVGGSLLTVAFQILVNSQPTAKLTVESVETVNNLMSCTIQKIKAALHCDT